MTAPLPVTPPRIDTQVHLIDPRAYPFPEAPAGYVPDEDEVGTLDDLIATLDRHEIGRAVLVPASVYGADNRILLDAHSRHPDRFRVIAGVETDDDVALACDHAGIVGIRLNLVDGKIETARLPSIARAVIDAQLILQIHAAPAVAADFVRSLDRPEGRILIDHLGRPDLAGRADDFVEMMRLSTFPNACLKASALFRIAKSARLAISDDEALRQLVEAFGPLRMVWGSDWPFINCKGPRPTYAEVLADLHALLGPDRFAAADANATRFFRWPV